MAHPPAQQNSDCRDEQLLLSMAATASHADRTKYWWDIALPGMKDDTATLERKVRTLPGIVDLEVCGGKVFRCWVDLPREYAGDPELFRAAATTVFPGERVYVERYVASKQS
jgi:hypothetical protein